MPKSNTSFQKGQSGNPNGAPKKEFTKRAFYEAFFSTKDPEEKKTRIEKVLESYYKSAVENGDISNQRHIIDQVYGKAKESIDANISGGVNITITKAWPKDE